MFVFNFKINSNLILKLFLFSLLIIVLCIVGISAYKLFAGFSNDPCLNTPKVYNLNTSNYTNVLKMVHDDIDTYIGQRINFSGYVYRVYDFDNSQFVLARDMIISSDHQTLVVGFLCHLDNASEYADGCWINITGTITKGNYHGSIPIIEIEQIEKIQKPTDEYVYPPDETFVQTSTIL